MKALSLVAMPLSRLSRVTEGSIPVRARAFRWAILGLVAAALTLLSGCRGGDSASAPAPSTPPASSAVAAPSSTAAPASPAQGATSAKRTKPQGAGSAGGAGAPCNPRGDENCPDDAGENDCGTVDAPDGHQVHVVAQSTPYGQVGCTDAINVVSDYYRDAPTRAEGTAHRLTVDGWTCLADTGAQGSGQIGCANHDGLNLRTRP